MKRILLPGDQERAICHKCKAVEPIKYRYRDVPFSDGKGMVHNVLVGVCDVCDSVVTTPPQSVPKIKAAREKALKPWETELPVTYVDVLDAVAAYIAPGIGTAFRKPLLTYYAHLYAHDEKLVHSMRGVVDKWRLMLEVGQHGEPLPKTRLSFKINETQSDDLAALLDETHLKKTALVKGLVSCIAEDVLGGAKPKREKELKAVAASCK